MKKPVTVLLILAVLIAGGALACLQYLRNQTLDRDVMENPAYTGDAQMLDGDFTYVDNDALLQVIAGTWVSGDGLWELRIQRDSDVAVTLEGETVLEDSLQFTYLQPGAVSTTEFTLETPVLSRGDAVLGQIESMYHEAGEDGGSIFMELACGDGSSMTLEFRKTA